MIKVITILDTIAEYTEVRVKEAKKVRSTEDIERDAHSMERGQFEFEHALSKEGLSFILECKKASPSKGIIAEDYPFLDIARIYEEAGADAISVLTEPEWFLGSNDHLKEIAETVNIPVLRKDFTVDEYMIYEAKLLGASAVLLIVSILSEYDLKKYMSICDDLGMSALVETHDENEIITAIAAGARIIGVNNRNLKDFTVNTDLSGHLRSLIPENILFVSESGVSSAEDVNRIKAFGADAVLVGETMMRSDDKKSRLKELRGF